MAYAANHAPALRSRRDTRSVGARCLRCSSYVAISTPGYPTSRPRSFVLVAEMLAALLTQAARAERIGDGSWQRWRWRWRLPTLTVVSAVARRMAVCAQDDSRHRQAAHVDSGADRVPGFFLSLPRPGRTTGEPQACVGSRGGCAPAPRSTTVFSFSATTRKCSSTPVGCSREGCCFSNRATLPPGRPAVDRRTPAPADAFRDRRGKRDAGSRWHVCDRGSLYPRALPACRRERVWETRARS